jgi:agmatinase
MGDAPLFTPPLTFMGMPAGAPGPGNRVAILGVPFDCGIHPFRIGSREGPASVRAQSGLTRRHHPTLADVDIPALLGAVDAGDVAGITPGKIADAHPRIEAAADAILQAGAVPIGIGGDGSVSLPLMRAAARHHPGLVALHVDSHTDAYPYNPDDPFDASNQFTHAAEEGLVDPNSTWHVGIRGFTGVRGVLKHADKLGFRVLTTEDLIRRGTAQAMTEFREVVADRPLYLCWDMDVFDPSVAPGVATPSWGGLTAREGIELMRSLSGLNIVAMDFNTVSPGHDVQGLAASLCGHMMMEAMILLAGRWGLLPEG